MVNNETQRFLVHIGLPKTATTAVQRYILQVLPTDKFNFIGTRQPRNANCSPLYQQLMQAIECETGEFDQRVPEVKEALAKLPTDVLHVLSEEMVTVDTKVPWQTKLSRLATIMEGTQYRLLVTVRDPSKAAFSLYVELYRSIQQQAPCFDDFLQSNQAAIYDYSVLFTTLEKLFHGNWCFIPFESVKQGRDFLNSFENLLDCKVPLQGLPKTNDKSRSGDGIKIAPLALEGWLGKAIHKTQILPAKFTLRILRRLFVKLPLPIDRTPIPGTNCVIPFPDWAFCEERYQESNRWLQQDDWLPMNATQRFSDRPVAANKH